MLHSRDQETHVCTLFSSLHCSHFIFGNVLITCQRIYWINNVYKESSKNKIKGCLTWFYSIFLVIVSSSKLECMILCRQHWVRILVMRRKQKTKIKPEHHVCVFKRTIKYVFLKLAKKSKITKKLISSVEINIIAETCL